MIADAKARGLDVDCDAYPYAAGSNPLKNLLPQWVQAGGVPAMIERLKLPETRARIRADIERDGLNNWGRIPSWDCVQISISPHLPQFAGRTIAGARRRARARTRSTRSATIWSTTRARPACWSPRSPRTTSSTSSPRRWRWSAPTAIASRPTAQVGKGMPHPRFYGTFPRIIDHYVRERGALPLELAIHKMTGATARALKLKDRGLLKEGYRADIAIFDPADFRDRATYADPHQFPSGARTTVIVNGEMVVENADAHRRAAGPGAAAGCERRGELRTADWLRGR